MRAPFLMSAATLLGAVAFTTPSQAQAGDAKTLYEANCRKCHGASGVPSKAMQQKFAKIASFDEAFVAKHSKDSIVTVLAKGKGEDMKPFKDKLTPAQMASVAAYVHDLATKTPASK